MGIRVSTKTEITGRYVSGYIEEFSDCNAVVVNHFEIERGGTYNAEYLRKIIEELQEVLEVVEAADVGDRIVAEEPKKEMDWKIHQKYGVGVVGNDVVSSVGFVPGAATAKATAAVAASLRNYMNSRAFGTPITLDDGNGSIDQVIQQHQGNRSSLPTAMKNLTP